MMSPHLSDGRGSFGSLPCSGQATQPGAITALRIQALHFRAAIIFPLLFLSLSQTSFRDCLKLSQVLKHSMPFPQLMEVYRITDGSSILKDSLDRVKGAP